MSKKFLIVLLVTIFYSGVTDASPVNEHNAEGILPEEKPPTASPVSIDHINKKVEQTPASTADHTAPIPPKTSPPLSHSDIPTVKTVTGNPSIAGTTTPVVSHDVVSKNDSSIKNATSVIDNKNTTLISDVKNASKSVDNKSNGVVSASVTTVAPSKANPPVASSTHAPENHSTTTAAPANATTTTITNVNNTNLTDVTTAAPNTSSDKVLSVINVPAPVQEKHFDGPSFIGGIVLTIGLTAIGFIAFKYYKSGKIDMNYRTF